MNSNSCVRRTEFSMASTSAGVSKLVHGKSVPAVDVTYEAIEDVLDADSDIDIEHEFSDNEVGVEDIGSDNEIDDFVPVGSKEESVLWRAINGSNINRHHFIDTSSGVQPHTQLNSDSLPHEIFLNFFTDNLVELIVTETNNYQDRVKQDLISNDKLTPKSRLHKWTDLTKDEFYSFISLIILMGIIRKPTLAMYWSTDEMLSTPFFGKCMAQNRFSEILRFLHFTSTNLPDDKLHKIRPVFEYLITKFMENYRPGEKVTVDESLMLWRGRLGWKQFIRTKRARFRHAQSAYKRNKNTMHSKSEYTFFYTMTKPKHLIANSKIAHKINIMSKYTRTISKTHTQEKKGKKTRGKEIGKKKCLTRHTYILFRCNSFVEIN